MGYQELTPEQLLSPAVGAAEITDRAWCVRWDTAAGADELVLGALPPALGFDTSGSTGPARRWQHSRDNAWREAGMLADFVRQDEPGAVVSFAPPVHVYGTLATLLLPARLGVPVWYRPDYIGAMPDTGQRRIVVVATPWIFSLLLRHMDWVRSFEHLTVLYSSAMLPADAGAFLEAAGPRRAAIVELLGSTETGGIAMRRWREGEPPAWTLFPDVRLAAADADGDGAEDGTAVPLVIRSPRLAHRPGEPVPQQWRTGDLVEPLDERTFRLLGRIGRLVKVNGRRINLDEAEHLLRATLDCADLGLLAVDAPMIGEHIDLYVVPRPGTGPDGVDLAPVRAILGVRPRRVHVVPRLSRSATGKLQHLSTSHTDSGIAT
ncbi:MULTISPECIES: class I adenylate-forming enzyme family protein [unclassified Streptomyces]|uniref:AMP-binding protein n=1 Tax=unclassified Streptomyces TaxID=2593676 RepID=UPI0008848D36|nr:MULTISPECIES: class I adenylate-forming enzyme family protein [unclassified Streptomyces]PBC83962.1 acyl-CoA synthetase (AMP-forming)/AMP-acid ligase II [Streptomyces sp. 2321.6]SDR36643.1 Acyl-CoA synthetase (AMP-forming)/AMP-acid ligase II [Streptomyces sp. KS_16]SED15056.1 Acyl-CoA synthetase (AMP-forming)/AMP-acid ligase II [Streptomyces sp. 2133.1]SEE64607.1 Acyl-CoA synthetase (AMP-forming)/AMP-acid ligase II [Streptomyces sp. 2112.3]SNC70041.1 Acyl-CoA synthetase (AMP-forming)/AMP-ac